MNANGRTALGMKSNVSRRVLILIKRHMDWYLKNIFAVCIWKNLLKKILWSNIKSNYKSRADSKEAQLCFPYFILHR